MRIATIIILIALTAIFVYEKSAVAENNIDWLTYKNTDYGFTLRYPPNLQPQKNFDTYYFLPDTWRAFNADAENFSETGKAIISIPVFKVEHIKSYPSYYTAELRIGASSNAKDLENCIKNNQDTKTINGITFHVFPLDDEGMMQYMHGISYRTIHNNQCFAIEQIETGSKMYTDDDSPNATHVPDSLLKNYYDQVGSIIQTFTFTK